MIKRVEDISAARELRMRGYSVNRIARELNASKGSVSVWVRDICLSPKQIDDLLKAKINLGNQQKASMVFSKKKREDRLGWQEEGRKEARDGNLLHLQGCMLYWAEGAKNKNTVKLANTDPEIIKLFAMFLEQMGVGKDDFYLYIRNYSSNGVSAQETMNFWNDLVGLNGEGKVKIVFDCDKRVPTKKKKNIHKFGICMICVNDTKIVQRIFGAIQEYAGFVREEWLK